ncbi:MAG: hypothetical protein HZB16_17010 [Armatimonadetes bacterium]|nr:hypothetical protein [Armatimonadota bacterium]
MDAKTLRETVIKPKLTSVFGMVIASSLVTKATTAAMAVPGEHDKARAMVSAVCNDPRVLSMWGAAQASKQGHEWIAMVP